MLLLRDPRWKGQRTSSRKLRISFRSHKVSFRLRPSNRSVLVAVDLQMQGDSRGTHVVILARKDSGDWIATGEMTFGGTGKNRCMYRDGTGSRKKSFHGGFESKVRPSFTVSPKFWVWLWLYSRKIVRFDDWVDLRTKQMGTRVRRHMRGAKE